MSDRTPDHYSVPIALRGSGARFAAILLVAVASLCLIPQVPDVNPRGEGKNIDRVAPFVPTPMDIVEKMLALARLDRYDRVYDLGSGDGRIVIMAAQKFGAEAVGVEIDAELFKQSSARIAELGLEKRAKILHEDMFDVNLRRATVVTLYLLTVVNEHLRPVLEKQLRPGARIVSHDFQIPGWEPDQVVELTSKNGVSHKLFLYIRP